MYLVFCITLECLICFTNCTFETKKIEFFCSISQERVSLFGEFAFFMQIYRILEGNPQGLKTAHSALYTIKYLIFCYKICWEPGFGKNDLKNGRDAAKIV